MDIRKCVFLSAWTSAWRSVVASKSGAIWPRRPALSARPESVRQHRGTPVRICVRGCGQAKQALPGRSHWVFTIDSRSARLRRITPRSPAVPNSPSMWRASCAHLIRSTRPRGTFRRSLPTRAGVSSRSPAAYLGLRLSQPRIRDNVKGSRLFPYRSASRLTLHVPIRAAHRMKPLVQRGMDRQRKWTSSAA